MSLNTLTEKMKAVREEIQRFDKEELAKEFASFFAEFPEVGSLVWTQYTPYFNDGDPCTFRVGDIEMFDKDGEEWYNKEKERNPRITAAGDALARFSGDAVTEVFQVVFDDGVKVTATREGFEVEEYSHD